MTQAYCVVQLKEVRVSLLCPVLEIAESSASGAAITAPEEDAEEFDEATDTFGHLSVDQNNEVSYRAL